MVELTSDSEIHYWVLEDLRNEIVFSFKRPMRCSAVTALRHYKWSVNLIPWLSKVPVITIKHYFVLYSDEACINVCIHCVELYDNRYRFHTYTYLALSSAQVLTYIQNRANWCSRCYYQNFFAIKGLDAAFTMSLAGPYPRRGQAGRCPTRIKFCPAWKNPTLAPYYYKPPH